MLAVICDDITADRTQLQEFCTRYAKEHCLPLTTLEYENAGELLKNQEARNADVMFLDIYMEGASGIDAARILRSKGYRGCLIFTTTSREHYADGFDVEATHYLLKPITWEFFCEAMRRVTNHKSTSERKIRVSIGRSELDINATGIQYIEVYGHKTLLHTTKGDLTVNQALSTLEKSLGGDPFLRCYRCYIINMDYVQRLKEDAFLMKDGKEIPLSRDGRMAIKNRYLSYIFEEMEE